MKKVLTIAAVLVLALSLAACAKGSLSVESDNEGVHAVATGAAEGSGTSHISIPEGYGLCINHIVNKGSFHVKATDSKTGTVAFDEDITDNILNLVDVQGDFDVVITAKDADGTVDIIAYDKEAQAVADATLDDALKDATGEDAEELGLSSSSSSSAAAQ